MTLHRERSRSVNRSRLLRTHWMEKVCSSLLLLDMLIVCCLVGCVLTLRSKLVCVARERRLPVWDCSVDHRRPLSARSTLDVSGVADGLGHAIDPRGPVRDATF